SAKRGRQRIRNRRLSLQDEAPRRAARGAEQSIGGGGGWRPRSDTGRKPTELPLRLARFGWRTSTRAVTPVRRCRNWREATSQSRRALDEMPTGARDLGREGQRPGRRSAADDSDSEDRSTDHQLLGAERDSSFLIRA